MAAGQNTEAEPTTPDFTISISPEISPPKGVKEEDVKDRARFILDLLLAHIGDALPLDGSESIDLRLGDCGDEPRYKKGKKQSIAYMDSFDFKEFKKANAKAKEELLLDQLAGILDRIAHAFRGDRKIIQDAKKNVLKAGFEAKTEITDLGTPVPEAAQGARLAVVRHLTRKGEDWTIEVKGKAGRVLRREVVAKGVDTEDATEKFKSFKWQDCSYVLLNAKGKASYKLELSEAKPDRAS